MLNFIQFFIESTLEYHDKLNPLIWSKEEFDSAARTNLLKLADFYLKDALIPKKAVKDILIVGGNANYNYSKYSDLDLHILVDKNKIPDCDAEIMDEYLKDKKTLWKLTHDVKIFGIPVEIYIQGLDEKYGKDQGVYSLKSNKWIQKPKKTRFNPDDPVVKRKVADLRHKIEYFMGHRVDKPQILNDFKEKIRVMRQNAVRSGGEFSVENLAFKELRNLGLIEKFSDYIKDVEDKSFSIEKRRKND
jgi:hypothetical protein